MNTSETADHAEHETAAAPRQSGGLERAVFPAMAADRDWQRATDLDVLDLGEAAVRRLEALAGLIGGTKDVGGLGESRRQVTGLAELLDDVAVVFRAVLAELQQRVGCEE